MPYTQCCTLLPPPCLPSPLLPLPSFRIHPTITEGMLRRIRVGGGRAVRHDGRHQHLCRLDREAGRQGQIHAAHIQYKPGEKGGGDKRLCPASDLPLHPNPQSSLFPQSPSLLSLKPHVFFPPLFCSHSVKCSFIKPIFRLGGCSLQAYPVY